MCDAPEPLASRLRATRDRLAAVSGARESLTYEPHVTLRTGFLVPPDELPAHIDRFGSHLARYAGAPPLIRAMSAPIHEPYPGPGGTERHFVGYPIAPDEGLMALHRHALAYSAYRKGPQAPFHPHLTLAFHDLTAEGAGAALADLEREPAPSPDAVAWRIDAVTLRIRGEATWEVVAELPVGDAG